MEFLDYLVSTAPEGETILVVEQVNGVWPAYLPNKKFKPGASTYVNTGLFSLESMGGKISASKVHVTYCSFMVFDDVGTDKTPNMPKCKPTWVIETSEGCFQWGFVFSEQPTKHDFSAAVEAFAAAGYTDPGAINPVRNVRLPGSVNRKPGRDNWAAVLTEFNEGVEYTLPELLAIHDVTPAESSSAEHKAIRLTDDGNDDVFSWLSEQGLVLSPPNASGFAGVICPNAENHTDGNPEGRYMPLTRSYCCLHGHCTEWNSERFLDWVAANGGPDRHAGLRDTILADTMAAALGKLTPNDVFTDVGAKHIAEVEVRELGRLERSEWAKKFAYVRTDDAYFDLTTRQELTRKSFNAIYRHVECRSMHGKSPKIDASIWYDEHRQADGAQVLDGLTYAAGEDAISARDRSLYGNTWVNARITPIPGDVSLWLAHVERLIPDPIERNHLLDVMAFKVQHPEIKINHAVLLAGSPGAGKDTLMAPFIVAVCGPHYKNQSIVDSKSLNSQFGYALESEIMIINELRPDQFKDRRELENQLKPIVAAPPETLTVNRKGLHPYDALNRVLVIAFSNFRDAIALPPDDRRWFVLWTYAPRMDTADSARMWDWYRTGGFSAIAGYLTTRDVSTFMPGAPPPMTEAKTLMGAHSMSPTEAWLTDQIMGRIGDFERGVIGAPLYRLIDRLQGQYDGKITQSALLHALKEAGWTDMGRLHTASLCKKQVWSCLTDVSKSDLRRMVEEVPASSPLVRVK